MTEKQNRKWKILKNSNTFKDDKLSTKKIKRWGWMLLISDQFVWADISEAVSRVTPESCRLYLASCEPVWAQTLQEKQTGSHHQWSRSRRSRRRRPLTSPPLPLTAVSSPQSVSRLSAHRRENQCFSRSLSSAGRWVQILSHQTPFKNHTFKGSVMTACF